MYVYTLRGRVSKGANRWCTSILHAVRALKSSGGSAAGARVLVLIGDNFAENKNNINYDFLCELVWRGVFDEIQLLFGLVGHTHNGVDAAHNIHNTNVGIHVAGTLGEWCNRFPQVYQTNVPVPKYLQTVYDFRARYDGLSQELHGFTKTSTSSAVHAFRVSRDAKGDVGLWWAPYASLRQNAWRGVTGEEGDPHPIVKLTRLPLTPLSPMKTQYDSIPRDQATDLTSKGLKQLLEELQMPGVFDWCAQAVEMGCLPLGENLGIRDGNLFPSYVIGVPPKACAIEVIGALPDDVMEFKFAPKPHMPPQEPEQV